MILTRCNLVGDGSDRQADVSVELPATGCALFLNVAGMENDHGNPLVSLDLHEGRLRLYIWGNRASEEYTHVYDLDGGRIEEVNYGA